MKKTLILVGFALVAILFNPAELTAISLDNEPKSLQQQVPPPAPKPKTAEDYIEDIFGDKAEIAKAVILHESQNSLTAKNWNCYYGGRSTFCKPQDRHKAWSVDCGIGQINVRGQVCPPELLTLEGNMKAIEKIYETQGLNAWVSYRTGAYKKYL